VLIVACSSEQPFRLLEERNAAGARPGRAPQRRIVFLRVEAPDTIPSANRNCGRRRRARTPRIDRLHRARVEHATVEAEAIGASANRLTNFGSSMRVAKRDTGMRGESLDSAAPTRSTCRQCCSPRSGQLVNVKFSPKSLEQGATSSPTTIVIRRANR